MKIPKTLTINQHQWTVEYKWNLTHQKKHCYGVCDPSTRTILIDRSLPKEMKFAAFIHEFMHACLDEHQIGHNSHKISLQKEERIIETLETELLENFKIRWRHER